LWFVYRAAGAFFVFGLEIALRHGWVDPETRVRTAERLGFWEQRGVGGSVSSGMGLRPIWIHAASVGEVGLARLLITAIRQRESAARILATCNTATGHRVAQSIGADEVHYCPIDTPRSLKRIMSLIEPSLLILVETELWPCLLMSASRRNIPVVVVNARISARSFPRYRRLRSLFGPLLSQIDAICARDQGSSEKLARMNCPKNRLVMTGDLKYDSLDAERIAATRVARDGDRAPFLLAASTHQGEEALVFELYERLHLDNPEFELVVAPRHPERAAEVVADASRRELPTVLWSKTKNGESGGRILIVDTVGELLGFMPRALGVFMGGSFVNVGGHNLLEPAAFGRPIVSGPHLANVAALAAELVEAGAMSVVDSVQGFEDVIRRWLRDRAEADEQGARGRAVIDANHGALDKTMAVLKPYLSAACG